MKVTIVGAGNIGLAMAAYIILNGKAEVIVFTGKALGSLRLNNFEKNEIQSINQVKTTKDPTDAFSKADIIFITYPAFLRKQFIEQYQDFIKPGTFIGFVSGYGGAE